MQTTLKPSPDVSTSLRHEFDRESLRFQDEKMLIDLVFTALPPHNFQDVKLTIDCTARKGNAARNKYLALTS